MSEPKLELNRAIPEAHEQPVADAGVPRLSIVVPVYNEERAIPMFYHRLVAVLEPMGSGFEVVFVNDGSEDGSRGKILELHQLDPRVKLVDFSRNFGKEVALTAGLDLARGEAVIPIDVDLQDPPEVIAQLVLKWEEGYDVVYATRVERRGETLAKRLTAFLFYRVIKKLTNIPIPPDTGDFRLISRPVVEALKELREQHRFMKGLFSWVGFKQTSITYQRDARLTGHSKFNYWKLWNFAIEGVTSFSIAPLQAATYIGFVVALASMVFAIYLTVNTIFLGNPVQGYPSLMVAVTFLGGAQLMTLGIIGEYIGRIYNESKRRPLYLVKEKIGL